MSNSHLSASSAIASMSIEGTPVSPPHSPDLPPCKATVFGSDHGELVAISKSVATVHCEVDIKPRIPNTEKGWTVVSALKPKGSRELFTANNTSHRSFGLYDGSIGKWAVVDKGDSALRDHDDTISASRKRLRPSRHDMEYDSGRVKKVRSKKPWFVGRLLY